MNIIDLWLIVNMFLKFRIKYKMNYKDFKRKSKLALLLDEDFIYLDVYKKLISITENGKLLLTEAYKYMDMYTYYFENEKIFSIDLASGVIDYYGLCRTFESELPSNVSYFIYEYIKEYFDIKYFEEMSNELKNRNI